MRFGNVELTMTTPNDQRNGECSSPNYAACTSSICNMLQGEKRARKIIHDRFVNAHGINLPYLEIGVVSGVYFLV